MVYLVTIHGIGDPPVEYAEPFAKALEACLEEPVGLRSVWYGDLSKNVGLGTPAARWLDYILDPFRYTIEAVLRRRLKRRIQAAVLDLPPERTLLVSHSWGTVVACNKFPNDAARVWVQFGSRKYWPTWFSKPPRSERRFNFWSPHDVLSEAWGKPCVDLAVPHLSHSPMWTDSKRARWVARLWRQSCSNDSPPPASPSS